MLLDPYSASRDLADERTLLKRGTMGSLPGPIAPPNPKSYLNLSSREFVPSSVLFQLQGDSLRVSQNKQRSLPQPARLPRPSFQDREDAAYNFIIDRLSNLTVQTTTSNNAAYNCSLATPLLTSSATTSSPHTSDSEAESPLKYAPAPNRITRNATAADLLYSPDFLKDDLLLSACSPTDSESEVPVMRGGELGYPLPFNGPTSWNAAPLNYPAAAAPRYSAPAPMPHAYPAYQPAPPVYAVSYQPYPTALPQPAPYPAPAVQVPRAPTQMNNDPWVREAMQHFQLMGRDGVDTTEGVLAAERFLAVLRQDNARGYPNYNPTGPTGWPTQHLISPSQGAYMARMLLPQLPQLIACGPDGLRLGISHLGPMPPDMGVAPNNRKKDLYKTEPCRNWEERGECRYQEKCQFAHGAAELRHIPRHPKYKTEFCRTWYTEGSCPYAGRCCFIHPADTNAAAMAGRMLPGPGGEPMFPRVPASTSRNQTSLLDRIGRNNSTDSQVEPSARSQVSTSPVNTRMMSPGVMSATSAAGSMANIGLPRVASTGNLSNLVENEVLGGRRPSTDSSGSGNVPTSGRGEDSSRVSVTAPPSPVGSDNSNISNVPLIPAHLMRTGRTPSSSPTAPHPANAGLSLRLNTAIATSTGGPQTAPAARANLSTASMFGPVSPTLHRSNPLTVSTPPPRVSAYTAAGATLRGISYATMNDLRSPPTARSMASHARTTSYNDSAASTPAPSVTNGTLALNIPRPAEIPPPAPLSASSSSWVSPFSAEQRR